MSVPLGVVQAGSAAAAHAAALAANAMTRTPEEGCGMCKYQSISSGARCICEADCGVYGCFAGPSNMPGSLRADYGYPVFE